MSFPRKRAKNVASLLCLTFFNQAMGWQWPYENSVCPSHIKSNLFCSNAISEKIDSNSDIEQDSKAQEALTAAFVNNAALVNRPTQCALKLRLTRA